MSTSDPEHTSPPTSPSQHPLLHDTPDNDEASLHDTLNGQTAHAGKLNYSSAFILVISHLIGTGIFATPGIITKSVGSVGLSLIVWILGAAIAACGMVVSLELGCMLPRSGGDKVYLEHAFPNPRFLTSTLIAMGAVFFEFTAAGCMVFGQYMAFALDFKPSDATVKTLAMGLLAIVTTMHGCFPRRGVVVQNFCGWIKIALILVMALTALLVVLFLPRFRSKTTPGFSPFYWQHLWQCSHLTWTNLSSAVYKVYFSYNGMSGVNNVMGEVKNPVRTLKTVLPLALATACFLYLLSVSAYFLVIPIDEMKSSGELVAAIFFYKVFGDRLLLPLAISLCAVGNVMVSTFALARVYQEIAREGFMPLGYFVSSSRPFGSPFGGLLVNFAVSSLAILVPPSHSAYYFIIDLKTYAQQFPAFAVAIALIVLRRTSPQFHRPFRAPMVFVSLRLLFCASLIIAPLLPSPGSQDTMQSQLMYPYFAWSIYGAGLLYWHEERMMLPTIE